MIRAINNILHFFKILEHCMLPSVRNEYHKIFFSLFQLTLLDENKTNAIKATEAIQLASTWETGQGPFGRPSSQAAAAVNNITSALEQTLKPTAAVTTPGGMIPRPGSAAGDIWEYEHIILERGGSGLGFSIAGM